MNTWLFECLGGSSLGSSVTHLRHHFVAVMFWILSCRGGVAGVVSLWFYPRCGFHRDGLSCPVPHRPSAALGRHPPWRMKLQHLALATAFLPGVSLTACTRQPKSASALASLKLRLSVWSSVRSWFLHLQSSSIFSPAPLPASAPVLHMSVPMRRGAVADANLGRR